MRLLEAHPEAGRPAEDMNPEFREWWIIFGSGGYIALYRLDGSRVVVLAVRHGKELGFLVLPWFEIRLPHRHGRA